jgi:hypothetical protein
MSGPNGPLLQVVQLCREQMQSDVVASGTLVLSLCCAFYSKTPCTFLSNICSLFKSAASACQELVQAVHTEHMCAVCLSSTRQKQDSHPS